MNNEKINTKTFLIIALTVLGIGYLYIAVARPFNISPGSSLQQRSFSPVDKVLAARFDFLSTHGNSSCSSSFQQSIPNMPDNSRLQGSCCSPMVESKYAEQVTNLKKYKDVSVIPSDPYDISAKLAKQLLVYDKIITPTAAEQKVLDVAVAASPEKGYCCCKCWRWYVYEGLSKYLVRHYHFTAKQITDVLANSDGCGGSS